MNSGNKLLVQYILFQPPKNKHHAYQITIIPIINSLFCLIVSASCRIDLFDSLQPDRSKLVNTKILKLIIFQQSIGYFNSTLIDIIQSHIKLLSYQSTLVYHLI